MTTLGPDRLFDCSMRSIVSDPNKALSSMRDLPEWVVLDVFDALFKHGKLNYRLARMFAASGWESITERMEILGLELWTPPLVKD